MQQQQPGGAGGADPSAASLPPATGATGTAAARSRANGGRFDFDDGGTYCGGWEEGKAHGHGVCTGPKGQGAYAGSWHYGFEVSGVYTWPSGSCFEGQWQNGKRHGLGVEARGRWVYRGEWTQGFKGRYGVRQSSASTAKYEGTWAHGLQDGCGSETYADGGTYQGQWMRGMRHGYGARHSAQFGKASKQRGAGGAAGRVAPARTASLASLADGAGGPADAVERRDRRADDGRGGFVLKANSGEPTARRGSVGGAGKRGLFGGIMLRKPRSMGDLDKRVNSGSIRSTGSSASWVSTDSAGSAMTNASVPSDSNASFVVEDEHLDPSVTETYMGEWKNDKRSGYGVSERSDGLKYEGEWYNNKKYGYGVTTFSNGEKEEGKYKNNVLVTSSKKKLFLMRSAKFRERLDAAVYAAQRASKIALQKADIAITRTATARGKAEQADLAAAQAREDAIVAEAVAKQYAPDFIQPDLKRIRDRRNKYREHAANESLDVNIGLDQKANPNLATMPTMPSLTANKLPNEAPMMQPNHIGNNPHSQSVKYQPNNAGYSNPTTANNPTITNNPGTHYNAAPNDFGGKPELAHAQAPLPHNNVQYAASQKANPIRNNPGNEFPGALPKRNSVTAEESPRNPAPPRRMSRISGDRPYLGSIGQQSSIDHFDHYKRPPSRDSSVDRYQKVTGRLNSQSRQPSVDRTPAPIGRPSETPDRMARAPSAVRGTTPAPTVPSVSARNGSVVSGQGVNSIGNSNGSASPPFEDIILRRRNLGQDIIPSPNQPKRTESLFIPGQPAQPAAKNLVTQTSLSRKKSLPDVQEMPRQVPMMSREEVSALGSARREEVRRQIGESERLRANPLLWLVSPQVKDWFSRQQLVIVILFINISLAIMFFKLLT